MKRAPLASKTERRRSGRPRLAVVTGTGAPVVPLAARRELRPRPETGFPRPVKTAVRKRAGGGDTGEARCENCGIWLGRYGGQVQHRDARGMGGSRRGNTADNGGLLCGDPLDRSTCHGRAEARDAGMNERGWWLRNGQDPARTPVTLWDGREVRLTGDGGYSDTPPGETA